MVIDHGNGESSLYAHLANVVVAVGQAGAQTSRNCVDVPLLGDWNRDGVTDLGVWAPATATFTQGFARLPTHGRAALRTVRFGTPRR